MTNEQIGWTVLGALVLSVCGPVIYLGVRDVKRRGKHGR